MVKGELQAILADHHTIERELGRGGMATVYLVQDVRHDRPGRAHLPRGAHWKFAR
jgi:hypothetical protein